MFRLLFILIILSSCGPSDFEEVYEKSPTPKYQVNIAAYGLLHPTFPATELHEALLEESIQKVGLAVLAGNIFGREYDTLELLLDTRRVHQVLLYLTWGGKLEDRICQPGTILFGLNGVEHQEALVRREEGWFLDRYRNALAEILPLIQKYPEVDWIVFPELESNLPPSLNNVLFLSLSNTPLPQLSLGYNPLIQSSDLGLSQIYEGHRQLNTPKPCIANNDGVSISIFDRDFFDSGEGPPFSIQETRDYFVQANCNYNYPWHASLSNGLDETNVVDGKYLLPRDRNFSRPDAKERWRRYLEIFKVPLIYFQAVVL